MAGKINSPDNTELTPKTPKYSHVTTHSDYKSAKEKQNPSKSGNKNYTQPNKERMKGTEWWHSASSRPVLWSAWRRSHAFVSRGKRYNQTCILSTSDFPPQMRSRNDWSRLNGGMTG
ncbi:hypothetical protein E2C01_032989 [Portunus trituberculatus]|uniref:Uncharacterized protein n=1 Tax=Portunus trituberculatus TaxID=210409 RepID=A0A5B7EYY1_PORTR|nr:hypothetical protein [Portunus trituberculatus]